MMLIKNKEVHKVFVPVCVNSPKSILKRLFPQLHINNRTYESEARDFIIENRAFINSIAKSFRIPSKLFAAILYTEMTSSSLGYPAANALSMTKTMVKGEDSSIGPGQVKTFHVTEWNTKLTIKEAAKALYYRDDFAIAASARVISEIYYSLGSTPSDLAGKVTFATWAVGRSIRTDFEEKKLWLLVADRYNSETGNPHYQKAFEDSLRIIEGFF